MQQVGHKPTVYIETTVISYLAARPSRDLVVAGQQQLTQEWWEGAPQRFALVASQLVLDEAQAGDPAAASRRSSYLESIELLDATDDALALVEEFLRTGAVPASAPDDAVHIAIAVANGVQYLVTWNCRHIANAAMRSRIERVCRSMGFEPTIICTPHELMEDDYAS